MSKGKKRVLQFGIAFIFVANLFGLASAIVSAIFLPSIWSYLVVLGVIAFDLYFCYVRLYEKKKARYPMVPPEGRQDIYFPRTDIPRPIHADARKMWEKKKRLAKIEKMRRKKSKKK